MGDLESINVALRVRSLLPLERSRGYQIAVEKINGENQILVNGTDAFSFNFVFDWHDTQEQVYNTSVSHVLDKLFSGFNVTILAYGQTGSGKTYTMGTAFNGTLDENMGVIPRAIQDIFKRTKDLSDEFDFVIKCSFMELYQEQLYDLLTEKSREESTINMREDRSGIIMVGLTEREVHSAMETTGCLVKGSTGRFVASTTMNQASSRSHAIFTITLQSIKKDESRAVTTSKFHLVDLAGSERSTKTGATGARFKESVKINQGLLALGNVISALAEEKGASFVRYRDSKLTRLLQDSLGGNSVTLMIACVSPADYSVVETLSTLRYADRVRRIKNKPIINQDPHAAEINRLKGIIQKLRAELLTKDSTALLSNNLEIDDDCVAAPFMATMSSKEQNRKYRELQVKYRNLLQQLQMTLHDVTEHEIIAQIAEATYEKIKQKAGEIKTYVRELCKTGKSPVEKGKLVDILMPIATLVEGLNEELSHADADTLKHKRLFSLVSSVRTADQDESEGYNRNMFEMNAIMQEVTERFTSKQIEINEELRCINRELNLKEQLQQKITLNDDVKEKLKECEQKIEALEAEKIDLQYKLRHFKENASPKRTEERRKRLRVLEQEISEMKRSNSKLLMIKEKETQKSRNLKNEIQDMKESKVKLIRAMRSKAENFRQHKMTFERELMQLKNKNHKMQNEMTRKELLHNEQRKQLMDLNKRLKNALERQKVAHTEKQKMQSAKGSTTASIKVDQITSLVDRELEVIIFLDDADYTLQQLIDDRGIINKRLAELQQQPSTTGPKCLVSKEIANLKKELEMLNVQIFDLQQKVHANDIDTLIKSVGEKVHNLAEARSVLKYLLKTLTAMRLEYVKITEELLLQNLVAEEKTNTAAKIINQMTLEYQQTIAKYEEKIQLALTSEREHYLKLQGEQERKIEQLMKELEKYKQLRDISFAANNKNQNQAKKVSPNFKKDEDEGKVDFSDSHCFADISDDDRHCSKRLYFRTNSVQYRKLHNDSSPIKMSSTICTTTSDSDSNKSPLNAFRQARINTSISSTAKSAVMTAAKKIKNLFLSCICPPEISNGY